MDCKTAGIYLCISIFMIVLILYYFQTNANEDNIDVNQYKINTKKLVNLDDKFNIKKYDIINDNVIIHNTYKKELINLKKNKEFIDYEEMNKKNNLLILKNKEIEENSKKLKILEFNKKINKLKYDIKSFKISSKIELQDFLNDYNNNKISKNEIKCLINNLKIQLDKNNKIINTLKENPDNDIPYEYIENYNKLLNIKNILIQKKINIFIKFK
jgi:hypothetical protein